MALSRRRDVISAQLIRELGQYHLKHFRNGEETQFLPDVMLRSHCCLFLPGKGQFLSSSPVPDSGKSTWSSVTRGVNREFGLVFCPNEDSVQIEYLPKELRTAHKSPLSIPSDCLLRLRYEFFTIEK